MIEPTLMPLTRTSPPSRNPFDAGEGRADLIAADRAHLARGVSEEQEQRGNHQDDRAHDGLDGVAYLIAHPQSGIHGS